MDHVTPLSRPHAPPVPGLPAFLPACATCNTSKGERTLPEWVASGLAPAAARQLLVDAAHDNQ
ncbi:hypothetical protein ACIBF5_09580 [Micromonospora sp. NPDC050417]|uniref:hypothetical protein n=1 Tax=Micromonospora sp. NPDC050417 TaxID=3364280 RepID=UPI0037BABB7F